MIERITLNRHLFQANTPPDLRHLIIDLSRAAREISYAIQTTEVGSSGSINQFGEEQLKLDVLSDRIIQQYLCESSLVHSFISEEHAEVVELEPKAPYSVVFDPLDGSSLVDANFAIGSIFGIYKGGDPTGRTPREQVAALYVLYGPRTVLVYSTGDGVHEFLLTDVGEYVLLRAYLGIADDATHYSPGNARAAREDPAFKKVLQHWIDASATLRYSGCMVADVHHILSKGQGVFTFVGGSSYPEGKLRLTFECGPFAYLIEQAGGAASDGTQPILDKAIKTVDQRTPIILGSANEVAVVCNLLSNAT